MRNRGKGLKTVLLAGVAACLLALPGFAQSHARIVRLSDVEGDVQVDRNAGQGFEKAFLNMPVVEGTKLWTRNNGRAEVEFEDGSVLHVTPESKVAFSQLSLLSSGGKVSTVHVDEGTLYVNFNGKRDDQFTVGFGRESTQLSEPVRFRVRMRDADADVAVFKGEVQLQGPSGAVEVGKNKSAIFNLADQDKYTLARNVEEDPYDQWDKQADQYHQRNYDNNTYASNNVPYRYGMSDLNYYGSYYNVPGYGYMWQPYFSGVGWSPFSSGAWMWYPGYGYTFVSSYPWGWLPYRYGSWQYVPTMGWMWQPGGWNQWQTIPRVVNPPQRFVVPQPPVRSSRDTVVVSSATGSGAVATSAPNRVVVSQGSAGMGIPRGAVKNLPKVSQQVATSGSAVVKTSPPARAMMVERGYGREDMYRSPGRTSASGSAARQTSPGRSSSPRSSSPRGSAPVRTPRTQR